MSRRKKPEMKEYEVSLRFTCEGSVVVEATSEEEAEERAVEAIEFGHEFSLADWKVRRVQEYRS